MFHVPRVWHSLPVTPLEAICGWADDFSDDERSFQGGREFMHAVGPLDASKDEVANDEGSFLNDAIMKASKLLVVTSLSHDSNKPLFFMVIEVDPTCLLDFSLFVELDAWSSKGDVDGYYGFRSVDQKEG
jgi:hypothetical protein